MASSPDPIDLTLQVVPRARFDVVDLRSRLAKPHREALAPYPRCFYWSLHTTAGFFDRSLVARLPRKHGVTGYVEAFKTIFPEGAGYEHDRLDRRTDLAPDQREVEPKNADSHLAFIASGLRTCVSYPNRANEPVLFVDLDGVNEGRARQRITRIIGYKTEEEVETLRIEVPVSSHPVDSINLKDPRLGIYDRLHASIARHGIRKGRVRLSLQATERQAGLAINEHETLLMRHDLAEVLRDPLRFAVEKGRHVLADPRAVPSKTLGYAQYDLVRIMNQVVDLLGLAHSRAEKIVARTLAFPLSRFFRMKRSVSLLVSSENGSDTPTIVEGIYQSPILVQWHRAPRQARIVEATITRLR